MRLLRYPTRNVSPARRYDIFTMLDDSLSAFGVRPGDEVVAVRDEYEPNAYHAFEEGAEIKIAKCLSRPPNLLGRVILPGEPMPGSAALVA
jgi:hypothetical protein